MKVSFNFFKQSKLGSDADQDWVFLVVSFFVITVGLLFVSGFEYYRVTTMKVDIENFVPSEQEFVKKQALQMTLEKYEKRKLKTESVQERSIIYIDPSL